MQPSKNVFGLQSVNTLPTASRFDKKQCNLLKTTCPKCHFALPSKNNWPIPTQKTIWMQNPIQKRFLIGISFFFAFYRPFFPCSVPGPRWAWTRILNSNLSKYVSNTPFPCARLDEIRKLPFRLRLGEMRKFSSERGYAVQRLHRLTCEKYYFFQVWCIVMQTIALSQVDNCLSLFNNKKQIIAMHFENLWNNIIWEYFYSSKKDNLQKSKLIWTWSTLEKTHHKIHSQNILQGQLNSVKLRIGLLWICSDMQEH